MFIQDRKLRNNLFACALVLFIVGSVFSSTQGIGDYLCDVFTFAVGDWSIHKPLISYIRACVLLLLLYKITLDIMDSKELAACQLFILSIVGLQALASHGRGLLFLFVFAFAARDIDIKAIGKIFLWTLSISISIVALLSINGFIEDVVYRGGGNGIDLLDAR